MFEGLVEKPYTPGVCRLKNLNFNQNLCPNIMDVNIKSVELSLSD